MNKEFSYAIYPTTSTDKGYLYEVEAICYFGYCKNQKIHISGLDQCSVFPSSAIIEILQISNTWKELREKIPFSFMLETHFGEFNISGGTVSYVEEKDNEEDLEEKIFKGTISYDEFLHIEAVFIGNPEGEINKMKIDDFYKQGYLQEANRQFFHPLGLALEIRMDDNDEHCEISGIWDYRDDPEGMVFEDSLLAASASREKAKRIQREQVTKATYRKEKLGFVIQPIPGLE
jgi:hypothetical protein